MKLCIGLEFNPIKKISKNGQFSMALSYLTYHTVNENCQRLGSNR